MLQKYSIFAILSQQKCLMPQNNVIQEEVITTLMISVLFSPVLGFIDVDL